MRRVRKAGTLASRAPCSRKMPMDVETKTGPPRWPPGHGETARRVREFDWASTPLGDSEDWAAELKTAAAFVLDSAHPAALVCRTGRVTIHNDAFRPIIGPGPEQFGRSFTEMRGEGWRELGTAVERALSGHPSMVADVALAIERPGAREEAAFTFSCSPVRSTDARVLGTIVTAFETTKARIQAPCDEAAFLASEKTYRTLFETMNQGFCIIEKIDTAPGQGSDYRYLVANPAFQRHTGLSAPVGKTIRDLVPSAEAEIMDIYDRVVRTGQPEHFVNRVSALDLWIEAYVFPTPAAGRIAVVFTDISERKRAEAALRESVEEQRVELERQVAQRTAELQESRDLFQAVIDSSTDMIQVFEAIRNEAGEIVDFRWVLNNRTSETTYGEVRDESLLEKNPGVIAEGIFDAFRRVTETGVAEQAEHHYRHEQFDGWFIQSVVKLGDGVATTTKAITDWKEAQADVMRLQEEAAQAKLRRSEELFRALATAGAASIYRMSPDWRRMYRLDSERLEETVEPTENWAERYILPEDLTMVSDAVEAAIASRSTFELEHRVRHADGSVGWVLSRAVPIFAPDGEIAEWFGAGSDITARKNAEQAVRESQRLQSTTLEVLPLGLALIGPDGRVILSNPEWARFTPGGFLPSRDPERGWRWRACDADGRRVEPQDFPGARALRGERVVPGMEFLYTDDTGAEIWTRVASVPLLGEEGEIVGAVSIIDDIDAAERAAEALRRSEERFRQFAEASSDLLWIRSGQSSQWEYLSPAFEAIYGIGREEALRGDDLHNWAQLIHPEDREGALAAIARVGRGEHVTFEYRIRRPIDGETRWLRNTDFPLLDRFGRVQRIGGIGQDVTEEKETAARMQVMVAELQHRTRNLIAVVQSIARQTMAETGPTEAFREAFNHRLEALARVQSLLSRSDEEPITIEALIRMELEAMSGLDGALERVFLDGPPVRLRESMVQTLALALHELATNARKHGALSEAGGRLEIAWTLREIDGGARRLALRWVEHADGDAIDIDPERRGYGRELIERALPYALGAETSYDLTPGGARCTIDLPLDKTHSRRRTR